MFFVFFAFFVTNGSAVDRLFCEVINLECNTPRGSGKSSIDSLIVKTPEAQPPGGVQGEDFPLAGPPSPGGWAHIGRTRAPARVQTMWHPALRVFFHRFSPPCFLSPLFPFSSLSVLPSILRTSIPCLSMSDPLVSDYSVTSIFLPLPRAKRSRSLPARLGMRATISFSTEIVERDRNEKLIWPHRPFIGPKIGGSRKRRSMGSPRGLLSPRPGGAGAGSHRTKKGPDRSGPAGI